MVNSIHLFCKFTNTVFSFIFTLYFSPLLREWLSPNLGSSFFSDVKTQACKGTHALGHVSFTVCPNALCLIFVSCQPCRHEISGMCFLLKPFPSSTHLVPTVATGGSEGPTLSTQKSRCTQPRVSELARGSCSPGSGLQQTDFRSSHEPQ